MEFLDYCLIFLAIFFITIIGYEIKRAGLIKKYLIKK